MSQRSLVALAAASLTLAASGARAATTVVTAAAPNNTFSPQAVTVRIGDTVVWNNVNGFHNVVSDPDGSIFYSGDPAIAPWSYSFTFTQAGTYGYHCQPHGAPGAGMFGTVIVLDSIELAHGSNMSEDLDGAPDRYRIGQKPYSSYEVVVDALAGNPLLQLDRVDASGTTVIQSGAPVTTAIDMTQSLRWENAAASAQDSERVRVSSSSCPTNCTVNDVYRVRAYETTLAIPRYNHTGSQATVLILQNPTDYTITYHVYFWSNAVLVGSDTLSIVAKGTRVIPTGGVPGVPGTSGTITVSHNGRYGDLTGKAVALEPATGFSFDTPAVTRPH